MHDHPDLSAVEALDIFDHIEQAQQILDRVNVPGASGTIPAALAALQDVRDALHRLVS